MPLATSSSRPQWTSRSAAHKQKEDNHDEDDPVPQIVQDGVSGVFEEIAAIDERNDPDAGRQDMIVHLLDFHAQSAQSGIRFGTLPEQCDSRYHVRVIDQLAVLAANRSGELPQPDLRTLRDNGNVPDMDGGAVFRQNDGVLDVANVPDQADFTDMICCIPASIKLPPALALLLVSCCSTWAKLSP